jgi:hypothetical protein
LTALSHSGIHTDMSTHAAILLVDDEGVVGIYCHFDGSVGQVGGILLEHYREPAGVRNLVGGGDVTVLVAPLGVSRTETKPPKRGKSWRDVASNIPHSGNVYVYEARRGHLRQWMYAVRESDDLVPLHVAYQAAGGRLWDLMVRMKGASVPDSRRDTPRPLTTERVELEIAVQVGFVRGDLVGHVVQALRGHSSTAEECLYSDAAIEAAVRGFLFAVRNQPL